MTDLTFLLLPLLVLPIVVLFRFVGCGSFGTTLEKPTPPPEQPPAPPPPPPKPAKVPYATSILAEESVIAYWRLLEPPGIAVAADQKGFQNGAYKGKQLFPDEGPPGTEGAPGTFDPNASLIASDSPPGAKPSRLFNGGYVHVEFKPDLYTDEFTIEAWVEPRWGVNVTGCRHTLFDASGTYVLPPDTDPALHGFLIFADTDNRWQVALAPGGDVFTKGPDVALSKTVHLAVTVQNEGTDKKVTLYLDGKPAAIETIDEYSRPDNAPLVIGVANANGDNPDQDPEPTQPVLSVIQEVVLHKKALIQLEVQNHVTLGK